MIHLITECEDTESHRAMLTAFGKGYIEETELHELPVNRLLKFAKEIKLEELTKTAYVQ